MYINLTFLDVAIAHPSRQQIQQLNQICILNTINSTTQSNTIKQQSQTLKSSNIIKQLFYKACEKSLSGNQIQEYLIESIHQLSTNSKQTSTTQPLITIYDDQKISHPVVILTLYQLWTTKSPKTKMTTTELDYYVDNLHTSYNEAFHSYLLQWAPKQTYYRQSYHPRICCAQMHWNENRMRVKISRGKKNKPESGKRSRGRYRTYWKTKPTYLWYYELCAILNNIK